MWAAPRSRSTAFFRSMLEHGGVVAVHEPFDNIADHGSAVVDGRPVADAAELIATLRALAETATVFVKETTDRRHPAVLADRRFLKEAAHTFLIRSPDEIAASIYALQGPGLTLPQLGLELAWELHEAILAAGGPAPIVIDSADLVADPAATVAAYCAAVGIPFRASALRWAAGERDEWRLSARWHVAVSESAGFSPSASSYQVTTANNAMLARFSEHHEPYYRALLDRKLRVR
jgi:hypothetical protein